MSYEYEPQEGLPVGFRGYRRKETDAYVAGLHQTYTTLLREKSELQRQVEGLKASIDEHDSRTRAVADALVTAQLVAEDIRVAAEAEIERERHDVVADRNRLAEELAAERQQLVDEGAAIRAEAHQAAAEIVREARVRGERLIEEVLSSIDEYQRETDHFLGGKRERLGSLVRDLLGRIPGSAPPAPAEADELDTEDAVTAAAWNSNVA
jgi:cell division septum initiation protein DivIVA